MPLWPLVHHLMLGSVTGFGLRTEPASDEASGWAPFSAARAAEQTDMRSESALRCDDFQRPSFARAAR